MIEPQLKDLVHVGISAALYFGAELVPGEQFKPVRRAMRSTGGAYLGTYVVNRFAQGLRESQADKEDGKTPEGDQAKRLHGALFPLGTVLSYGVAPVGNEKDALAVALNITCWDKVKASYKKRYDRTLTVDLQDYLTPDAYKAFDAALQRNNKHLACGKTDASGKVLTPGDLSVTHGPGTPIYVSHMEGANLRSSSQLIWKYSPLNNIYGLAPNGTYLGEATGEQGFDKESKVYFTQVRQKTSAGRVITFWVANSQISSKRPASPRAIPGDLLAKIK